MRHDMLGGKCANSRVPGHCASGEPPLPRHYIEGEEGSRGDHTHFVAVCLFFCLGGGGGGGRGWVRGWWWLEDGAVPPAAASGGGLALV